MFGKLKWIASFLKCLPERIKLRLSDDWDSKGWRGAWTEIGNQKTGRIVMRHRVWRYENKTTGENVYKYAGPLGRTFVGDNYLDGSKWGWEEGNFKRTSYLLDHSMVTYAPLEDRLHPDS